MTTSMIVLHQCSAGLAALTILLALPSCSKSSRQLPPTDTPGSIPSLSRRDFVGLNRRQAALKAWSAGQSYRIVEIDGKVMPPKGPRHPDRLNFTIENGVVVKVTKG